MALAVVIGAIFGLRWAGQRFFGISSVGDGGVVKVLSRSTIGPRQQVILMQVGKRVLVVANSATGINTLCEVSDGEEIASLVSEAKRPVIERAKSFKSLFGRAEANFDGDVQEETAKEIAEKEDVAEVATTREEISGLLDKVRNLTRDFRRA
jgi:flagellar biogenesis protein FliO